MISFLEGNIFFLLACRYSNYYGMKILKIIYFIALFICAIELFLFLFGPRGIFYTVKEAMFMPAKGDRIISIGALYSVDSNYVRILKFLTKMNTAGYVLSLVGASLSAVFYNLDRKTKYTIGIVCCVASLIFLFVTGPVWQHLIVVHYS